MFQLSSRSYSYTVPEVSRKITKRIKTVSVKKKIVKICDKVEPPIILIYCLFSNSIFNRGFTLYSDIFITLFSDTKHKSKCELSFDFGERRFLPENT